MRYCKRPRSLFEARKSTVLNDALNKEKRWKCRKQFNKPLVKMGKNLKKLSASKGIAVHTIQFNISPNVHTCGVFVNGCFSLFDRNLWGTLEKE